MRYAVDREHNLENLRFVTERLASMEYAIFFGTLLGFQREGNIIETDDDIDIYVNARHRQEVLDVFKGTALRIQPNVPRNSTPHFLQGVRRYDNVQTFVDFYFYEDDPEKDYISERWNFSGKWDKPENCIHIPKQIFYPLVETTMQGITVNTPADPVAVCEYLYGSSWMTPLSKGPQYRMSVVDNRPQLTRWGKPGQKAQIH